MSSTFTKKLLQKNIFRKYKKLTKNIFRKILFEKKNNQQKFLKEKFIKVDDLPLRIKSGGLFWGPQIRFYCMDLHTIEKSYFLSKFPNKNFAANFSMVISSLLKVIRTWFSIATNCPLTDLLMCWFSLYFYLFFPQIPCMFSCKSNFQFRNSTSWATRQSSRSVSCRPSASAGHGPARQLSTERCGCFDSCPTTEFGSYASGSAKSANHHDCKFNRVRKLHNGLSSRSVCSRTTACFSTNSCRSCCTTTTAWFDTVS